MNVSTKIKMLMAIHEMTGTQLAAKLGMTQSNFSKKMSKGKFSIEEMERIAEVFNARYEASFILENGDKV